MCHKCGVLVAGSCMCLKSLVGQQAPDSPKKDDCDCHSHTHLKKTHEIDISSRDAMVNTTLNPITVSLYGAIPEGFKALTLQSASIPLNINVINSNNNVLTVTESLGPLTITASITPGNYTSGSLATEIATQLTAASLATGNSYTYTCTIPSSTNKCTIATSANFTIRGDLTPTTSICRLLGYKPIQSAAALSQVGSWMVNIGPPSRIFIQTDIVSSSVVTSNINNTGSQFVVPVTVPIYDTAYTDFYQFQQTQRLAVNSSGISSITVTLKDDRGALLDILSDYTILFQLT